MEVQVLGPVRVVRDGEDVALNGPRERAVLAALALAGPEGTDTARLVDLVWGEDPPRTAARTAQAYLSRLRATLGADAVVSGARRHRLVVDAVDLWSFRDLVQHARTHPSEAPGALRAALSLWRDPVPACDAPLDGATVDLVALTRGRLDAAEQLLSHLDDDEAADLAEAVLAEEPHREAVWLRLAAARYRQGRAADALAVLRRARRHLVDELGLDPAPALVALERDILNHRLGSGTGSSLPVPLTPLVGRADLLAEVTARLQSSRLVTLVGTGGIGKTRAAIAAAEARPGAAHFAALAGATTARAVESAVLRAVGADPDRDDAPEAVAARLETAVGLVVLDSCEHAVPAVAALVLQLLQRCPGITVLATSRTALGVPGEVLVEVPSLPLETDAIALFLARAADVADVGAWTDEDLTVAKAVCRAVDGLPLALELTARRLRHSTVHTVLEQLGDSPQPGVAAAIEASYAVLTDEERLAFRRLAHLHGQVPGTAAAEVAGGAHLVSALGDCSLLVTGGGGVRMYEPVRQYATRATSAEERAVTLRRVATAVLALAEEARPHLVGPDEQRWLDSMDRAHDDVRSVLEWAAAHEEEDTLSRLAASVGYLWLLGWGVREGRPWIERALGSADGTTRGQLLVWACLIALRRGELDATRALGDDAVRAGRALGDLWLLGQALHARAQPDKYAEGADLARRLLREAVDVRRDAGDLAGAAMSLGALADIDVNLGELDSAAEGYALGLPLMRRSGSGRGLLAYLHSMAELELQRGDAQRAVDLVLQAEPLAVQVQDTWHAALLALVRVSAARQLRAPLEEQRALARRLLSACAAQTDPVVTLDGLDAVAGVLLDGGEPAPALRLLRAARRLRTSQSTPIAVLRRAARDADEEVAARAVQLPETDVDLGVDWLLLVAAEALS